MADNKQEIATKLPINIDNLLHQRTIESDEQIIKQIGIPKALSARFQPSLMVFVILVAVMWCLAKLKKTAGKQHT